MALLSLADTRGVHCTGQKDFLRQSPREKAQRNRQRPSRSLGAHTVHSSLLLDSVVYCWTVQSTDGQCSLLLDSVV
jgi:hypothetical protein